MKFEKNKKSMLLAIGGFSIILISGIIIYVNFLPLNKKTSIAQANTEQIKDYMTDVKVLHLRR